MHIRGNRLVAARYRYRREAGRATEGLPRAPKLRDRHPQAPTRTVDRHTTGRDVLLSEKITTTTLECSIRRWCAFATGTKNGQPEPSRTNGYRKPSTMNLPIRSFVFLRIIFERFHVILNSLFKVLFNFSLRYLFAIGLVVIFSYRWSSPHT